MKNLEKMTPQERAEIQQLAKAALKKMEEAEAEKDKAPLKGNNGQPGAEAAANANAAGTSDTSASASAPKAANSDA